MCWHHDEGGNHENQTTQWSSLVERLDLKGEEELGKKIILRALEESIRQIADNAGHEGSVVANTVKSFAGAKGFNADT